MQLENVLFDKNDFLIEVTSELFLIIALFKHKIGFKIRMWLIF